MNRTAHRTDLASTAKARGSIDASPTWREAGWIFKDGTVIAIERRESLVRARFERDAEGAGTD